MKTESVKIIGVEDQDSLFFPKGVKNRIYKRYLRWNYQDNQQYVEFLRRHQEMFNDPIGRRSKAIYNKMAIQLNNGRNNHQCRSHHMKMLKKYSTIQGIINQILDDPRLDKKQKQSPPERRNTDLPASEEVSVAVEARNAGNHERDGNNLMEYMPNKSEGNLEKIPQKQDLIHQHSQQAIKIENVIIGGTNISKNSNKNKTEPYGFCQFPFNTFGSAFKLVKSSQK